VFSFRVFLKGGEEELMSFLFGWELGSTSDHDRYGRQTIVDVRILHNIIL